ncbi:unnamed protein product, partial [marine sediment metagenome]
MKSHAIVTEGDPGSFDITDKDNPLYYIARYCHECSDNLYHLSDEGFMWEQTLAADVTTHESSWNTYIVAMLGLDESSINRVGGWGHNHP